MISSSGIHRAHGSQDVFDTLVTRAFRKLAGFTACFFQPCRCVGVGQLKERSAGQIRLLLNCFGGKDCFNDFVSEKGVLHFYQDGRRLEPRYTNLTENITFKVGNNQQVRAAKGFELISTTGSVDAVLYGDDGTVIQSYTIPLS